MYHLTLTNIRYGFPSSTENYYAQDDNQLAEIKDYLFDKQDIKNAVEVEYSLNNKPCEPTDNWDEVYWTFELTEDTPKWGYLITIEPIKFGKEVA